LAAQTRVGDIVVREDAKEIGRVPAVTADPVEKASGLLERFF
jgi:hypothetical protein